MKVVLENGNLDNKIEFKLVDKFGNSYSDAKGGGGGSMLTYWELDHYIKIDGKDTKLELVPKIILLVGNLKLDGKDYKTAIDERAKQIGYDTQLGPLY